jgi:hypothetical protein
MRNPSDWESDAQHSGCFVLMFLNLFLFVTLPFF